jgi:5'-3' exonuclease
MSVTPEVEMNLIAALRRLSIPVIVAPNEADSQLAYLCVSGRCQAVMTEDSDILVYSAVCGVPFQILYKYDKQRESVQSIDMSKIINMEEDSALDTSPDNNIKCNNEFEDLEECDFADEGDENRPNIGTLSRSNSVTSVSSVSTVSSDGSLAGKKRKKDSKAGFLAQLKSHFHGINGRRMFVQMCILAGCDYNDSIYGVGLITAMQAILQHKNSPNNQRLRAVCKYFISQNKSVSEAYIKRIMKSEQMFYYPFVYNPSIHAVRHFMDLNVIDEQKASIELEVESNSRVSSQISSIGNSQTGLKRRKSYNGRNGESLTISMNRQDEPCAIVESSRSPSCSADQSSPFIGESEAMELQQTLNTINAGIVNIEGQHPSDLKSISISDICEGKVFSIRGMGNASSVNSHNAGGAILSDPR